VRQSTLAIATAVLLCIAGSLVANTQWAGVTAAPSAVALSIEGPEPPEETLKLVFIHHSCGDNWLSASGGDLGNALGATNYYVSDTYYGWGPDEIGSLTDIGNWWSWFCGPDSSEYMHAVFITNNQNASYSRPIADPGGENAIVMFKSCYPNSHLEGSPTDPATTGDNPLRGEDCYSGNHNIANAKGIYNDLLATFEAKPEKLFVAVTAPPLVPNDTDARGAENARAFNNWLVNDWLDGYPLNNVVVYDYYNVLTSNGGNTQTNDVGSATGNHHRWWEDAEQHLQTVDNDRASYGQSASDSHPTSAGHQKATNEFVPLLNYWVDLWLNGSGEPTPTPTVEPAVTLTVRPSTTTEPSSTPTTERTVPPQVIQLLPLILK